LYAVEGAATASISLLPVSAAWWGGAFWRVPDVHWDRSQQWLYVVLYVSCTSVQLF
jgi:hypothetical protein